MENRNRVRWVYLSFILTGMLITIGCGKKDTQPAQNPPDDDVHKNVQDVSDTTHSHATVESEFDHLWKGILEQPDERKKLKIEDCAIVTDLSNLEKLPVLHTFTLAACENVKDISPLGKLKNLERLSLRDCDNIGDLTPLSELKSLKILKVTRCPKITQDQIDRLQKQLPNCEISFKVQTLEPTQ